jgi:hypothetical protein
MENPNAKRVSVVAQSSGRARAAAQAQVRPASGRPPVTAGSLFARHGRGAMKFGIFYELQLPKPWEADSEYVLFNNALDQIELADRLGYDYAWEVEHHFLEA